jgi:hypothetical protein
MERLIRSCLPIPQIIQCDKEVKKKEIEKYFPGFLAFKDCTGQPIPRTKTRQERFMEILHN